MNCCCYLKSSVNVKDLEKEFFKLVSISIEPTFVIFYNRHDDDYMQVLQEILHKKKYFMNKTRVHHTTGPIIIEYNGKVYDAGHIFILIDDIRINQQQQQQQQHQQQHPNIPVAQEIPDIPLGIAITN
jgi:hypothetical protein